jgi:hypothetical protein
MTKDEYIAALRREVEGAEETQQPQTKQQYIESLRAKVKDAEPMTTSEKVQGFGLTALDGLLFGAGDEVASFGRALLDEGMDFINPELSGPGDTFGERYDNYLAENRKVNEQLSDEMPVASTAVEIGTSIVPAFKLAGAVGNAGTRLGNVARQGALGAGETAVREVGMNEGSLKERIEDIDPTLVGIGAGIGGAFGGLMRGQQSIDAIKARDAASVSGKGAKTAAGLEDSGGIKGTIASYRDDLYAQVKRQVSDTDARNLNKADTIGMGWKQALHAPDKLPVKDLDHLTKVFKNDGAASKLIADMNAMKKVGKDFENVFTAPQRKALMDSAIKRLAKTDARAAETLRKMNTVLETVQMDMRRVFPNIKDEFKDGYFPLYAKSEKIFKGYKRRSSLPKKDSSTAVRETGTITPRQAVEEFDNPVHNFMNFFEDATDALALARAWNVKVPAKSLKGVHSYADSVIKQIEKKAKKDYGEDVGKALGENLRLFALDGRQSMGSFFHLMRTLSHSALLGTLENAALQAGDIGMSAYATNLMSATKALPKALWSMLVSDGDMVVTSRGLGTTLRMADLGWTRQHLTEMINQSNNPVNRVATKAADFFMQVGGVRKANRAGVETLLNASVNQMKGLAKKGKDALANSVYAEGLSQQDIDRLYRGIMSGNVRDRAVKEAAFFKAARHQPVARSAMTPQYLEMRDGRLLYSMKSYMVKQAARFNEDVIRKVYQAERKGLQTAEGRKLMREALINTARYGTFIVALNSVVDPARKSFFRGIESDSSFGEEFVNQSVNFATGGFVNPGLSKYGVGQAESLIPPALQATYAPIELSMKYLQGDDITPAEVKRMAMFYPGARQAYWWMDVVEENFD